MCFCTRGSELCPLGVFCTGPWRVAPGLVIAGRSGRVTRVPCPRLCRLSGPGAAAPGSHWVSRDFPAPVQTVMCRYTGNAVWVFHCCSAGHSGVFELCVKSNGWEEPCEDGFKSRRMKGLWRLLTW